MQGGKKLAPTGVGRRGRGKERLPGTVSGTGGPVGRRRVRCTQLAVGELCETAAPHESAPHHCVHQPIAPTTPEPAWHPHHAHHAQYPQRAQHAPSSRLKAKIFSWSATCAVLRAPTMMPATCRRGSTAGRRVGCDDNSEQWEGAAGQCLGVLSEQHARQQPQPRLQRQALLGASQAVGPEAKGQPGKAGRQAGALSPEACPAPSGRRRLQC